MLPPKFACPRCTCRACYALHRKGFDWVVSLVGLRPARCLTCNRRFYARYTTADDVKVVSPGNNGVPGFVHPKPAKDAKQKVMDTAA